MVDIEKWLRKCMPSRAHTICEQKSRHDHGILTKMHDFRLLHKSDAPLESNNNAKCLQTMQNDPTNFSNTDGKFRKQSKTCRTMEFDQQRTKLTHNTFFPINWELFLLSFINGELCAQFADNTRKHQQLLGCVGCRAPNVANNLFEKPDMPQ